MENRISIALKLMGFLSLLGAIAVGFSSYEMPIEGYQYATDKDYAVLFTWIGSGAISLVIFLGFAEIINLLEANKNNTNKLIDLMGKDSKHNPAEHQKNDSQNKRSAVKNNPEKVEEMKKELKSRGYGDDLIESIIAEETTEQN